MDLENTLLSLAPNLLRFCKGISGDRAEGEDLAQDSLSALVRFWKQSGPPASPAAFVYTVARRQAGRFQRRRRRLMIQDTMDTHPDPGCGPELAGILSQRLERVLKLMQGLPRRERQALLIAMDREISVQEASQALGISASAFKMRVYRARQHLRTRLEENHEIKKNDEK